MTTSVKTLDVSPPVEHPTITSIIANAKPIKTYEQFQQNWERGPGSARVVIIPANDAVFAALGAILKLQPVKSGKRNVFLVDEGRSDVVVLPTLPPGVTGVDELVSHMSFFAPAATGVAVSTGHGLPQPFTYTIEDVRLGDVVVGTLGAYAGEDPSPLIHACPTLTLKANGLVHACGLTVPIGNPQHLVQNIVAAIFSDGVASTVGQNFQIPDVNSDDLRNKDRTNPNPSWRRPGNDTYILSGAVRHSRAGAGVPAQGYDAPRAQCDHAGRITQKLQQLQHPSIAVIGIEDYSPPATGNIWRKFAASHAAVVTKAMVL